MATHFPYETGKGLEYTNEPSVYKIFVSNKYFIFKGKTFKASVEQNLSDIEKMRLKSERKIDHLFWPVVEYIKRYRIPKAFVELVCQTADPADLVECERRTLMAAKGDPDCLNKVFEPHIPKWLSEQLTAAVPGSSRQTAEVRDKPTQNKALQGAMTPGDNIPHAIERSSQGVPKKADEDKTNRLLAALTKTSGKK